MLKNLASSDVQTASLYNEWNWMNGWWILGKIITYMIVIHWFSSSHGAIGDSLPPWQPHQMWRLCLTITQSSHTTKHQQCHDLAKRGDTLMMKCFGWQTVGFHHKRTKLRRHFLNEREKYSLVRDLLNLHYLYIETHCNINPAKKETPHSFKGQQLENKSLYRFVIYMVFLEKYLSYNLT